jgi:putative glutamine amidotransferase
LNLLKNADVTPTKTALATNTSPWVPPIIGITAYSDKQNSNFYSPAGYSKAVRLAGGIAILLPPVESDPAAILEIVDGLIFTGGGDIEPALYNGIMHPTIYGIDPERDASELPLAKLALKTNIPILGICRGLEVLMVASGGDLIPHVPEEFGEAVIHRIEVLRPAQHSVQILPGSRLADIVGTTVLETVVSWHHQAVRRAPMGWRVTAQAPDGVIEALEHEHHTWAIALQWHPEMSLGDALQQQIFQAFVDAAVARKVVRSRA